MVVDVRVDVRVDVCVDTYAEMSTFISHVGSRLALSISCGLRPMARAIISAGRVPQMMEGMIW